MLSTGIGSRDGVVVNGQVTVRVVDLSRTLVRKSIPAP